MTVKRVEKQYTNVEAVDVIHQAANFYISTRMPKDYGTGEEYTSVEVHTLKYIADNPGITVTKLARDNGKTKGANSQILKKLENKGLIYRETSAGDNKCPLHLTEKGKLLDQAHRAYDEARSGDAINQVRELYTSEEINLAFSVLETWLYARREVQEQRMQRERKQKREKKSGMPCGIQRRENKL